MGVVEHNMKILNVACGTRFHNDWINIDFQSSSPEVNAINILNGLPYDNNSFDVVYSSHFLEHLTKKQADFVLSEIIRILKPGGIVRIIVPDLQNICREYLNILSDIQDNFNKKRYEWIIIELLDQMVRTNLGGEMLEMYRSENTLHDDFLKEYIFTRVGERINPLNVSVSSIRAGRISNLTLKKIKKSLYFSYISILKKLFPQSIKDSLILNTSIGEKHLWMYDSYSLSEKLKRIGFIKIKFFNHNESQIPNFSNYYLDTNMDGTPYKGISSLYCEAIKP